MLKKKLGIEAFERNWSWRKGLVDCFKISSSTLIIPEGVKRIGVSAFENCKLEKIIVPKSVERIGNEAFCDCHRLKKVEIPEGVEEIWDCAFYGCEEATITLRKSKKDFAKIGVRAFYGVRKVKEEIIY